MLRQIILDTETTGLDPKSGHRVIEIGCIELINRKFTGEQFHVYLNPDRDSDEAALEVHGLTTEFLSDKPRFKDIYKDFTNKIRSDLQQKGLSISAHNSMSIYSPDYNNKTKMSEQNFLKISFFKSLFRKLFIKLKIINRKDHQKLFLNNLKKTELNDDEINELLKKRFVW